MPRDAAGLHPSPSSEAIEFGPLTIRAYGLMIALGVLARCGWPRSGGRPVSGSPDDISTIAMWAVPAGLIGSRLYHVLTDWRFDEGFWTPFKIWEGGLGIPGGMAAGILVGLWVVRRRGWDRATILGTAVPSLPSPRRSAAWATGSTRSCSGARAPSRGRWRSPEHRPREYADAATFHPTFLYEAIWNLGLTVFLIWLGRSGRVRKGSLLAVYVLGYFVARLWLETVRIDHASEVLGLRISIWTGLIGIVVAGAWLLRRGRAAPTAQRTGAAGVEAVEVLFPTTRRRSRFNA
ncbi:MAG: prolipoprotein diacylglyceryl transferase [Acidimicrobiales bacterium]